jgi:hypothetical protein
MRRRIVDLPKGTIDETGHTYRYLTVREYAGVDPTSGTGHALWLCDCECGQDGCLGQVKVRGTKLRSRITTSCGRARANRDIRQAARMQTPARRRTEIAKMGGAAFACAHAKQ